MRARPLLLLLAPAVLLILVARAEPTGAQVSPMPVGWVPLGQVTLDKNGCASCPARFPTPTRSRGFGLATDSPFPVALTGRIDVTCANGTTYDVLLRSATRGGVFQSVPNTCVNLDSKELKLAITSVSLSPPDAERTVALAVYTRIP